MALKGLWSEDEDAPPGLVNMDDSVDDSAAANREQEKAAGGAPRNRVYECIHVTTTSFVRSSSSLSQSLHATSFHFDAHMISYE